eukprot:TRINITY_DN564_c0_g1_i1.p2 TRINITY_DN564_c0_g1~~TRINITY_DN564_c0_g1_i1.p2  ORF type:complete len:312 (+),score=61.68 TRINITY_DN564_c0_g1_i1:1097-2032(+)
MGNSNKKDKEGNVTHTVTVPVPTPECTAQPQTQPQPQPQLQATGSQRTHKKARTRSVQLQPPALLGNLHEMYDINPNHSALKKRWEANKKFRESGLEAEFAREVLGSLFGKDEWEYRYNNMLGNIAPLAFSCKEEFDEFVLEIRRILRAQNLTGWFALRGSSTTFLSVHPEKGCNPNYNSILDEWEKDKTFPTSRTNLHYFDCKVVAQGGREQVHRLYNGYQLMEVYSDIDLNIKSEELISLLKASGTSVSSANVGSCYNQDATMDCIPELWEFKAKWGELLQRDISFVAVASAKDEHKYSGHPFTFRIEG